MEKWLIIVSFIIIICVFAKIYYDTNVFKVSRVQFHSSKVPVDFEFKILQISDLHNKIFGDDNQKLIDTVEKLKPDIIVVTGDLIDSKTGDFKSIFFLLESIKKVNRDVFYVFGNHEWKNKYIGQYYIGLQQRQITILNNKNVQLTKKGVILNLIGVDDISTEHEDVKKALNNLNQKYYTILLSHSPDILKKYDITVDLILSGHTHGGQVRIPLIGALLYPGQGLFPELDKGRYETDSGQYLYIDSGLGTSHFPVRFLNQSQLSLITIMG